MAVLGVRKYACAAIGDAFLPYGALADLPHRLGLGYRNEGLADLPHRLGLGYRNGGLGVRKYACAAIGCAFLPNGALAPAPPMDDEQGTTTSSEECS
jgi:hypothetical protein